MSRSVLILALLIGTAVLAQTPDTATPAAPATPPPRTQQSPEQLQQLVAPIALYADSLVAQILAAATFPEQVVEADRFLQSNPSLQGQALAQAVDGQTWDPSVKALTAFPAVLGNMDKNLSWTSSLGDAYYNQPDDVMSAIQAMRQRAQSAGNLQTTPQQTVTTEGADIDIQPASPEVVYVPAFDPWVVYGAPIAPWPDWYLYPGVWFAGPYLSFGVGFPIGFFGGFGWGWHHWGFDWQNRHVQFDRGPYMSHSTTFYNRGNFYGGARVRGGVEGGARGAVPRGAPARNFGRAFTSPGVTPRPFGGNVPAARGYAPPQGQSGIRSGAFSGYSGGGDTRGFASRGSASFGGGGARGGGGFHGGGRR